MQTFRHLDAKLGLVPAPVVRSLGGIDEPSGREELYRRQRPAVLDRLLAVARIQSAASSSALEGVTAPSKRIKELMAERSAPRNRSEAEIAGYRRALDLIHRSASHMPFTPAVVLQVHRDLYSFTAEPGGRWKTADNHIEEVAADGSRRAVFDTVPFGETPAAMAELHDRFAEAAGSRRHHPLLLVGAYALDFLCIHPFLDGNGRMARLLTLLLLYQAGYGVGRYVSLERLVETTKDGYYDTLRRSSRRWHEGEHDVWPWLEYLLAVIRAAYAELEERVGVLAGRGAKAEAIEGFVRAVPAGAEFTVDDVRRHGAGSSDSYISKVLTRLRDTGLIAAVGRGRGARWRRLADPARHRLDAEDGAGVASPR